MQDTLRDCRPQDRHCLSYLPIISPVYFVTFVLTAQFVLVNVVVAVLMKHLEDSNKEAQLEEMEERAERREREEASRGLSTASVGGEPGLNLDVPAQVTPSAGHASDFRERAASEGDNSGDSSYDLMRQVQVEDEKGSHGNLQSMGRMLSLPSDNSFQPLRCSPYPLIGHEAYSGYSFSGNFGFFTLPH